MTDVEGRVRRLQTQVWILTALVVVLVAAVGGAAIWSHSMFRYRSELTAGQINVLARDSRSGAAFLNLRPDPQTAELILNSTWTGRSMVRLMTTEQGDQELTFRDRAGHVRLRLGVNPTGEPLLELLGAKGETVWAPK
jgi:hypothetical protein